MRPRQLVTLSEMARRYGVSRQSVHNWVIAYDTFPHPILGHRQRIEAVSNYGNKLKYIIYDPHNKVNLYDLVAVDMWLKSGAIKGRLWTEEDEIRLQARIKNKKPVKKKRKRRKKKRAT